MKNILLLGTISLMLVACHRSSTPAYTWEQDLAQRLEREFSLTREEVRTAIAEIIPEVTDEQIDGWIAVGHLETMQRDGQTYFFRRSINNLFRLDSLCHARKLAQQKPFNDSARGTSIDSHKQHQAESLRQIVVEQTPISCPRHLHVNMRIVVDADAVPAGEIVRCWMPYPRADVARQTDIVFGSANRPVIFSPRGSTHSSTYMEAIAKDGEPTIFEQSFDYTLHAEYRPFTNQQVMPYDTASDIYRYYTAERQNHIRFTPQMRALSDSLTAGLDNPLDKLRALYDYVDAFPWAGARDYSTIENIPEYVLHYHHGDCGEQTLLLLTLARIAGLPCRFQSGLTTAEQDWNMHDWSEFYFEGIGWVPVDVSRGAMHYPGVPSDFYLFGIDNERLIVNNDYGMPLSPAKQFPRSDAVDFQRGEVEWRGGNLYYNVWSFNMTYE